MITKMKAISIIKKAGMPYSTSSGFRSSSGFSAKSWGENPEIEITYSGRDSVEQWTKLVNAILAIDPITNIHYSVGEYGQVRVYLNSYYEHGEVWNAARFATEMQVFVKKWAKAAEVERKAKQDKADKYAIDLAARRALAAQLNPQLMEKAIWLEGSEYTDTGVGLVTGHGNTGHTNIYMLFSWERHEFFSEKYTLEYYIHISLTSDIADRGGRDNGSTSINEIKNLRDGLLEYLVIWAIRVPESAE